MTKADIHQAVLDAFRVEYREQVEEIRSLVERLKAGEDNARNSRLQDALRIAHSFKGGARLCDLRDAERLGHGLEAVFEQIGQGGLDLTEDTITILTLVLDSIDDCMAAIDKPPFPDVSPALQAIDHILAVRSRPPQEEHVAADRANLLLDVFRREYAQHRGRLRQFEDSWQPGTTIGQPDLGEAIRIAHTLCGAAGVAGVHAVANIGDALEASLHELSAGGRFLTAAAGHQFAHFLEAMDLEMRSLDESTRGQPSAELPEPSPAREQPPGRQRTPPEDDSTAEISEEYSKSVEPDSNESVRVSVNSLDRLMHTSADLWTDSQRFEHFTRHLRELRRELDELDRERQSLRRESAAGLHKLADRPELEPIGRYLEFVDRQVSGVARRMRQLTADSRRLAWTLGRRSEQMQRDVRATRMVPVHSLFQGFRKMVRDLARDAGKDVELRITGFDLHADRMVLQSLKDPLIHILRNCITHGIEAGPRRQECGKPAMSRVSLDVRITGNRLHIAVEDDGIGIDVQRVARQAVRQSLVSEAVAGQLSDDEILSLVFRSGFSTADSVTELAGRGMGLSIVQDAVARLQGDVKLTSQAQRGTRIAISVPISISTHRVMFVRCGRHTLGIPVQSIEQLMRRKEHETEVVEGQPVVIHRNRPIPLTQLARLFCLEPSDGMDGRQHAVPIVLMKSGDKRLAIAVDGFVEERSVLVLDLDEFARCPEVFGGTLVEDGQIALVLQPSAVFERWQRGRSSEAPAAPTDGEPSAPPKILIVDDSFTTRTLEQSLLEANGYRVSLAVDGAEALMHLRREKFAAVISDIEMPRVDGFALLQQMKADERLADTPVILVTSRDKLEDQQRGLQLGAEAYIVKRKFDHQELLSTIEQVL